MAKTVSVLASKTLALVVNDPLFFLSHRLNLALKAKSLGMRVVIITPPGEACEDIRRRGLEHIPWMLHRWGANPFRELRSILTAWKIFRALKPDLVHLVTIKPVLYGSLAARAAGVPARVCAISGRGQVFTQTGARAGFRRAVVELLYRIALSDSRCRVIFQNEDDRSTFLSAGLVREQQSHLIPGAGVDVEQFKPQPLTSSICTVLFASRLLIEKGVREFVEAARILRRKGTEARFVLAGAIAPGNPTSISEGEYHRWTKEGIVDCVGYQKDLRSFLAESDIVTLPSYYGEGVPKILIEAAACGKAIVTTDWPGCRDIVTDQVNGLLVPPRDSTALAAALESLIRDPSVRKEMGRRGREKVLSGGFSEEQVLQRTFDIYQELLLPPPH